MASASKSSDVHADIPAPSQRSWIPPVPEGSAGPDEQAVPNDYDCFAEAYSAQNETSLFTPTMSSPQCWTWPGT